MRLAPRRLLPFAVLLSAAVGLGGALAPAADAAAGVRPVSKVHVVKREDHVLRIGFALPAADYHDGATVVVRMTRGSKPAARPGAGGIRVATPVQHQVNAVGLRADTRYTFAIWVREHGRYSKRVVFQSRTRKDVTAPEDVRGPQATAKIGGDGGPRVVLDWTDPCCDDLVSIQIVRNTSATAKGGTVLTVPAGVEAWTDLYPPLTTDGHYSTSPVYYFLRGRDRAGHFSRGFARASVVVGSRTISGTVSRDDVGVFVFADQEPTMEASYVDGQSASSSVNGGAFTFHLPPGRYTVCQSSGATNDPGASCWIADTSSTGHTVAWSGDSEGVASPTIDVTTATSYTAVTF